MTLRVAGMLVIVTLSGAGTVAVADDASYAARVQQQIPLSQEFPAMDTYKREQTNSTAQQTPVTHSAAASQRNPHGNPRACRVYTPEWPYSVPG
jgi:hypothetical protein